MPASHEANSSKFPNSGFDYANDVFSDPSDDNTDGTRETDNKETMIGKMDNYSKEKGNPVLRRKRNGNFGFSLLQSPFQTENKIHPWVVNPPLILVFKTTA
ncbi:predicted protein [Histoplasma capsulatum H143]|uniref:Uncharacterized protein n=1 Tax=Ajellomyces capsulatus (strain H143) TaxID=544712 RepID=C6H274_AJECH|nr:predicted protein [Histoplasma capsulatum H143]